MFPAELTSEGYCLREKPKKYPQQTKNNFINFIGHILSVLIQTIILGFITATILIVLSGLLLVLISFILDLILYSSPPLFIPFVGVLILATLYLLVLIYRIIIIPYFKQALAESRLCSSKLFLDSYPLRLGEDHCVMFTRKSKKKYDFPHDSQIKAKMLIVEIATSGKDDEFDSTRTRTEIIKKQELKIKNIEINKKRVLCHFYLHIDPNLHPSFEAENNQIHWILSVEQNYPEIVKNIKSNFTLNVTP